MLYDPHLALALIDQNRTTILACLVITAIFALLYFGISVRMSRQQKIFTVPLATAAVIFWHDLSFVLMYREWFVVYDHWWVKLWWVLLLGAVAFEVVLLAQILRYGHAELWPELSRPAFHALIVLGTLGIGVLWWLLKTALGDPLWFLTFAITAVWPAPFHTAVMLRRRSRAGQSVAIQLCCIAMILSMSAAFAQIAPFFRSPIYLAFVLVFVLWSVANIVLIRRLPEGRAQAEVPAGVAGSHA